MSHAFPKRVRVFSRVLNREELAELVSTSAGIGFYVGVESGMSYALTLEQAIARSVTIE